jgi:hypothetical protein
VSLLTIDWEDEMSRSKMLSRVLLLLAVPLVGAVSPGSADDKPVLRLRATAMDPGGATAEGGRRASTGMLELGIERWTTDADHAKLAAILAEKGEDSLLNALQKLPRAGFIRTPTSLGWEIHYARQVPLPDGGRRIIIATDRPMNFYELWNRPRSADYQFTLSEIRLGPDGRGTGTLVPAARIDYNESTKTIEVENYASQPVRLTDVRVEK